MKKLLLTTRLPLVPLVIVVAVTPVQAGITFADWTSVDTTTNVAVGAWCGVAVTLSGGDINSGITDGSFAGFNYPFFTPQLMSSDMVEFLGPNPPSMFTYTVSFTTPVTNPRLHIGSLASTLTFNTALTKLSGQADFVVVGNSVTGAYHDPASPTDSNGTVELAGTLSSFTFTSQAVFVTGSDGIDLQIGADQADTDADGLADECDPCTNVGGARNITVKPKVVVSKINTDLEPTNDALKIAGEFIDAIAFNTLDPLSNGARLIIQNAGGASEVDVMLASGPLGGKGTRGWKVNGRGTKWTFQDKTGTPNNGITKMIIQDRSNKAPNRVKVMVKGKRGTYPIVAGDEPIKATLVLGGQPASIAGQCGETVFVAADCSFNRRMNKLTCKP